MYSNIRYLPKLKQRQKTKAFTLLELLVVIFVLGIGILSIVLLISRNLSLTQDLHMRNTATLLAREGIELAFNHRNTNLLLGHERNCAIRKNWERADNTSSWCTQYYYSDNNNTFIIEGIGTGNTQVKLTLANTGNTQLYLYSGDKISYYTHNQSGTIPTPYDRNIVFEMMTGLNNSAITTGDIYTITSTVSFAYGANNATKTGAISLQSFISNPNP